MIRFILGGARSGKSRFAQMIANELATKNNLPIYYLATATALDDEMTNRIIHHQQNRPSHFYTVEQPIYLAKAIDDIATPCVIIVDCLTLWITNLLLSDDEDLFKQETQHLIELLQTLPNEKTLILVSNEVGFGIVPMGELNRRFVDESGFLHQKIAQLADNVVFCMAGLPLRLKGDTTQI